MSTQAEAFDAHIRQTREAQDAARKRDGDFAHGQIVGASFVLDRIGAPTYRGRYLLSIEQRIDAYLERRGR